VLTAGGDGTAGLWDAFSGRALSVLKAHAKRLSGAAFSPDERRILTWSLEEGSARTWDARSASALATIPISEHRDVPPWTGLRTAGCHLALVRRVAERRPDVQFVSYDRGAYRRWLGSRPDSETLRTVWAAARAEKTEPETIG
jgi:WD40 repeat protein